MRAYKELVQSLDHLVKVYRQLLEIVRQENDVLTKADLKEIPRINLAKEKLVAKVRELDMHWQQSANQIAAGLNLENTKPTLLELSKCFEGDQAKKLEQVHSVLTLLVERITEWNKKNGVLVQAALSHITGAMDSITSFLNENPTYEKSGSMDAANKDAQGRLMSREA